MRFSFSESEPNCNGSFELSPQVFRTTYAPAPTLSNVADRRTAETLYIADRVRSDIAAGKYAKDIAEEVNLAPAAISNLVNNRTGVRPANFDRWRRYLGFPTVEAMQAEAYERFGARKPDDEQLVDPSMRTAIDQLAELNQAPREHIVAIARKLASSNPAWVGHAAEFWFYTLAGVLKGEAAIGAAAQAAQRTAERDKRARKSEINSAMRAGHRRRKEAKEEPDVPEVPQPRRATGGVR